MASVPLFTVSAVDGGGLRNNYGDPVGCRVLIGSSDFSVTHLGRWVVSGNSGTHTVFVVRASTGTTVASVSVNTSGATPGDFKYEPLGAPVTLLAGEYYYLFTSESGGGDQWYNSPAVTMTADGVVGDLLDAYIFSSTPQDGTIASSYGPANLLYDDTSVAPAPFANVAHTIKAGSTNGGTTDGVDTSSATVFVVGASWYDGTTAAVTVSDNKGNTYTPLTKRVTTNAAVQLFYCVDGTGGSGHTVTVSGTDTSPAIYFAAFSLGDGYRAEFDQEAGDGDATPGSLTPGEDGSLILTAAVSNLAGTYAASGFVVDRSSYNAGVTMGGAGGYKIQPTAAAVTPTWTGSGVAASTMVVFAAVPEILSATLDKTLTDVTLASAGVVSISGSAAPSLNNSILSAVGQVAVTGSSAPSLAAVTLASAGVVPIAGTFTTTLTGFSITSVAVVPLTGSGAVSLENVTISAAGGLGSTGSSSITLTDSTVSAAGVLVIAGSSSPAVAAVTLFSLGAGAQAVGVVDTTLAAASLSASGTVAVAGTASPTIANFTLASVGAVAIAGTVSTTLSSCAVTSAGGLAVTGSSSPALGGVTLTAAGLLADYTGSLSRPLSGFTVAATGRVDVRGAAAITLANFTLTTTTPSTPTVPPFFIDARYPDILFVAARLPDEIYIPASIEPYTGGKMAAPKTKIEVYVIEDRPFRAAVENVPAGGTDLWEVEFVIADARGEPVKVRKYTGDDSLVLSDSANGVFTGTLTVEDIETLGEGRFHGMLNRINDGSRRVLAEADIRILAGSTGEVVEV